MSIRRRVEDALMLYHHGRYEGAILNALIAVAASSKKEITNPSVSDREAFESFLDKRWRGVIKVEFRGQLQSIPYILYKWFRCKLVHEGQLPLDVELIDTDAMSIRAGGTPEFTL